MSSLSDGETTAVEVHPQLINLRDTIYLAS